MALNIKRQVVNKVSCNDIDNLINSHYGLEPNSFSCVASEEWSNDSEHEFDVEKEPLGKWEQKHITELKAGDYPSFCLNSVLQDLCNAGEIEPGVYLITVCW